MRLAIDYGHAYAWSRTRMGGWRVAQSPILNTTITIKRLEKKGYESLLSYYLKVSPLPIAIGISEPLYTRPAWFTLNVVDGFTLNAVDGFTQSDSEGYSGLPTFYSRR